MSLITMSMITIRPLLISFFLVSFSYLTCQMWAVSFQVFQFYSEVCSARTILGTRRERSGTSNTSLRYTLFSFRCSLTELLLFV